MNMEAIRRYWDEQARDRGPDPRATTQDYWMREVEIAQISRILSRWDQPLRILDIGCGNGYSTIRLQRTHLIHRFIGGDYSEPMITAACGALAEVDAPVRDRIQFKVLDVLRLGEYRSSFDVVVSDRCLINLPSRELQWDAIDEIWKSLTPRGHYVAVENFEGGQRNLNEQRQKLGLKPIPIRWHNRFFDEDEFLAHCVQKFELNEFTPISSTYYLVTRVVYSKLCEVEGREPDYDHPIYRIAGALPVVGDFGPIKLVHM